MSQCRLAAWTLLRWALALVFLYAAFLKLRGAASLAASIARFQMLPDFLIHPMALGLPPLEALCGITLLAGPWKRQAAFSIALLCALFLTALVCAAARGITVECSCFGAAVAEPLWRLIARDFLLLGAALALYFHSVLPESPVGNKTSRCLH